MCVSNLCVKFVCVCVCIHVVASYIYIHTYIHTYICAHSQKVFHACGAHSHTPRTGLTFCLYTNMGEEILHTNHAALCHIMKGVDVLLELHGYGHILRCWRRSWAGRRTRPRPFSSCLLSHRLPAVLFSVYDSFEDPCRVDRSSLSDREHQNPNPVAIQ